MTGLPVRMGIMLRRFIPSPIYTKINDSPHVFVMGINPGSGGTYKEQCESEYWQLGGKPMDGTHLLKGNPSWSKRFDWSYWQRIYRLFDSNPHPLDDGTDFIVTNATFFATPKAKNLLPQLLAETLPYTLELIEIARPRMIVVLSGNSLLKTIKAHCDATGWRLEYSQTFASLGNISPDIWRAFHVAVSLIRCRMSIP